MKIAAAVLTRNQFQHGRRELFERTVDSLKTAGVELYVIDNASTDGTADLVSAATDWKPFLSSAANTTSGFGTWTCCRILAATNADLCVVSDDDMEWHPHFALELADWWDNAPADLAITGAHLEPEFFWNQISQTVEYGGIRGLIRASTGAASWTFPRRNYERLAAVVRTLPIDRQGHWDVPVCAGLRERLWKIGQVDLAEHIGQGFSSWGNGTEDLYGWNVDAVRAKL